jgi:hypothetical protein
VSYEPYSESQPSTRNGFGTRFIATPFRHQVMPWRASWDLLDLVQLRSGHDFDQGHELDAEDIEIGMPFADVGNRLM